MSHHSSTRIAFRLRWRGQRLRVEITPGQAEYQLLDGAGLTLRHHGQLITLTMGSPVIQPTPPAPPTDHLTQPLGREPLARRPSGEATG
ncbi:MAG: glycosyl hydrolase family 65 protein [Pseudonocardiaceae bacterium]